MLVCVLNPRPVLFPSVSQKEGTRKHGTLFINSGTKLYMRFQSMRNHGNCTSLYKVWILLNLFFLSHSQNAHAFFTLQHMYREKETVHISIYLAKYLSTYLSSTCIFRDNHMLFLTLVLDRLVPIHLLSQKPYIVPTSQLSQSKAPKIIMTWQVSK